MITAEQLALLAVLSGSSHGLAPVCSTAKGWVCSLVGTDKAMRVNLADGPAGQTPPLRKGDVVFTVTFARPFKKPPAVFCQPGSQSAMVFDCYLEDPDRRCIEPRPDGFTLRAPRKIEPGDYKIQCLVVGND